MFAEEKLKGDWLGKGLGGALCGVRAVALLCTCA